MRAKKLSCKREEEIGVSYTKSPVDSYLCVCVCNGSTPGRAVNARTIRVCSCTRKVKGACTCVCHRHSPVDSYLRVSVYVAILTPVNDCDYIRQLFYC